MGLREATEFDLEEERKKLEAIEGKLEGVSEFLCPICSHALIPFGLFTQEAVCAKCLLIWQLLVRMPGSDRRHMVEHYVLGKEKRARSLEQR